MSNDDKKVMAEGNVIELKPGHFYLFVFNCHVASRQNIIKLRESLAADGITGVSFALNGPTDQMQVIDTGTVQPVAG